MTLLVCSFFLLALLIANTWGDVAISFVQPVSVSASLGKEIQISCTLSGGTIATHTISWFQHQLPNPPKYLLYYKDGSNQRRKTGVSDRFVASKDASRNACYLTISEVQAADEGTYYCLTSSGSEYVFGGGTQLTVTGQPTVPPTLNAYASSEEEIKTHNKATLACLMSGFYPPAFSLKWKGGNEEITSGVETTKATKQGDKYVASSYLTLSASDYQNYEQYTCEVVHGGKNFAKTVRKPGSC